MLLPAPKFSKFLHGAALLLQPACANVPYWFLPGAAAAGPLAVQSRHSVHQLPKLAARMCALRFPSGRPHPPFLADAEDPDRMTPASWEEMAKPAQEYIKVGRLRWVQHAKQQ